MPEYDEAAARLTFKLVYYGPAQGGKTTNLAALHDLLGSQMKGEMMTLETHGDRTLFFDLLPLGFRAPSGLLIKARLFTVPGQVAHDSTRKAVLSRADGIVFVADSQLTQETNNAESFKNLSDNCGRVGIDFERVPLVVQFNKRDLPAIVAEDVIRARWTGARWPLFFSSAIHGRGVTETYRALLTATYRHHEREYELVTRHGLNEDAFVQGLAG
jgi:signal recognition particle receptor subunit beta